MRKYEWRLKGRAGKNKINQNKIFNFSARVYHEIIPSVQYFFFLLALKTFDLISPAKINLSLQIGSFSHTLEKHEIQTDMLIIDLADRINITPVEKKKVQITVVGKYAKGIPNNENNLIHKAIRQFFEHRPFSEGFEIILEKNIPSGAGLGGGSSNAAQVLRFLHDRYQVKLDPAQYGALGSDIPFFLSGHHCAHVSGFGEIIKPIPLAKLLGTEKKYRVELSLFPEFHISTAWAYHQLKWERAHKHISQYSPPLKKLNNDFEPIVLSRFFDLQKELNIIQQKNPIAYGMSGSGATLFGIFTQ